MDDNFLNLLPNLMSPHPEERNPAEEIWGDLLNDNFVFCLEQLISMLSDRSQVEYLFLMYNSCIVKFRISLNLLIGPCFKRLFWHFIKTDFESNQFKFKFR